MKALIIVIAILAAGVYLIIRWESSAAPFVSSPQTARKTTATVERRSIQFSITAAGDIGPLDAVSVRPEIGGLISKLELDIGDKVKKGDILFELNDKDLQAEMASRKVEIAGARLAVETQGILLEKSNLNFDRVKALFESKLVAKEVFDSERIDHELAKNSLAIALNRLETAQTALQQVKNVLMSTHKGIEDFSFNTNENWSDNIATAIRNARLTGGIIAAISLLVGGVGIMNIMLASITERIREIGVRKAIGATFFAVLIQILIESIVIAAIGGVAGLLASKGLVKFLALLSPGDDAPVITVSAMLLGFSFSVCVGVLAGIIPGLKAARLDPIQALRYE